MRRDLFPDGVGFGGEQSFHGGGLLFVGAAARIRADGFDGKVLCRAMQPAGQYRVVRELPGILSQGHKRALRDILGQVGVVNHPQRGGIHVVNMALHEFGKCLLGSALSVIAQ